MSKQGERSERGSGQRIPAGASAGVAGRPPGLRVWKRVAPGPWLPAQWEDLLDDSASDSALVRADLLVATEPELEWRLRRLHPDPLLLERCLDTDARSGVFAYDGLLALQLPVAEDWTAAHHPKLTLLCLPRALVTVRLEAGLAWLANAPTLAPEGPRAVAELLVALLDELIDRASEQVLAARRQVESLEMDLAGEDGSMDLDAAAGRILRHKRAMAHFEMSLEADHRTLTALLAQPAPAPDLRSVREPLRDVVAHVEHNLRTVERMEDHLAELHEHTQLVVQSHTNARLRLLTILSAVFMPLSLIAGIYGMNFYRMPELSWRYGYPAVLGCMLLLALVLLGYFYLRGWFR